MRKIGILGGSFNPIHNAHLMMAQNAYEQFQLDDMWLIPAKFPPHKQDVSFNDEHRLNMLRLAVSSCSGLSIHLYEYLKDGLSYTVETLQAFHEIYPDTEFYFIMGADSLYDFPKWHMPAEIARLATIVVACRKGYDSEFEQLLVKRREEYGNPFFKLQMDLMPISSTEIRDCILSGRKLNDFIPECVENYIKKHNLYRF